MKELVKEIIGQIEACGNELMEDRWNVAEKEILSIIGKLSQFVEECLVQQLELPIGLLDIIESLIKAVQVKDCIQVSDLLLYDIVGVLQIYEC